jgi:cysteinyl-tRNA synthetase
VPFAAFAPACGIVDPAGSLFYSRSPMSQLKIYNTLARDKQEFVPIVAGKAGMYVWA